MGNSSSSSDDETPTPEEELVCEEHQMNLASGFCLTHKSLLCISCFATKTHSADSCTFWEVDVLDDELKNCLRMKQHIIEAYDTTKSNCSTIEADLKKDIDITYDNILKRLGELKEITYEETVDKIESIKLREYETFDDSMQLLNDAIDCFTAGEERDGLQLVNTVISMKFCAALKYKKAHRNRYLVEVEEVMFDKPGKSWEKRYIQKKVEKPEPDPSETTLAQRRIERKQIENEEEKSEAAEAETDVEDGIQKRDTSNTQDINP